MQPGQELGDCVLFKVEPSLICSILPVSSEGIDSKN